MAEPSDHELIQLTLQGQTEAFGKLVQRYQNRLYRSLLCLLGSREDSRDVTQQAFVRAFRKLSQFREDAAFYSWLYRIAMNEAASFRRRQRPVHSLDDRPEDVRPYDPGDDRRDGMPSEMAELTERRAAVWRAIDELPDEFRAVLVLKEIDGLKYEEIADVLDCPLGTVRSRLHRARALLREKLKDELDRI